jgi:hypothetical protein
MSISVPTSAQKVIKVRSLHVRGVSMRKASELSYYRDVFGGWRWESCDRAGEAIDSRNGFETLEECVEDARRCAATPRNSTPVTDHKPLRIAQRTRSSASQTLLLQEARE